MARVGLTHDRVVAEAASIADEVGLAGLTVTAIAGRVGVAQPSVYKHIDNLDSLHRDLAVLGLRELAREATRAVAGKARTDALFSVADAYRAYAIRRPGPYEASLRAPEPGDAEHTAAAAEVLNLASAVLDGYQISGDDLIDAIRFLRAALHGYVALEAAGGTKMPRDNDLSYRRMVSGLDLAFASWPSTSIDIHHPAPEQAAASTPDRTASR